MPNTGEQRLVRGCATVPKTDSAGVVQDKPCTLATITARAAIKLVVAGRKPLLNTVAGSTDGLLANVKQTAVTANTNQNKFSTV